VVSYEECAPAKDVFDFLCRVSLRRVLVVEQGRPLGVISREGYLRWFCNWIASNHPPGASGGPTADDAEHSVGLGQLAEALVSHAAQLKRQLDTEQEDLVPYLVGEATRMQELLNDLLAHCQQARTPAL
jgi:hypothetical protein